MSFLDKHSIDQLLHQRDKLKVITEIYSEFNAMIREKQKEEN